MRENKTCPYQGWQQMSTEELDRILQAELEKEHPDQEVVLPILHELEKREKDIPVEKTPEVLALLNKLSKHETSSKQSIYKRRWITAVVAAAAIICIVVISAIPTAHAESFFDRLSRWTSSVFEFLNPDENKSYPNASSDFATDNPGLQQLYDKVTELGVTELVVPTWLPKGFELSDFTVSPILNGNKVHAEFAGLNDMILVTYRISADISAKVEKEETGVELFECNKVGHFIVENEGSISATWTVDGVECVINANVPKEDICTIIKSIYRSELSE